MGDGGIIPYETTVNVLIKHMLANKSKNYVIDGFPRAVDQAQYFEQNVTEIQTIINYETSMESMTEALTERTKTSTRFDDTLESVKKRIQNYQDQTLNVLEYYKVFGKTRTVDGNLESAEKYRVTRELLMPQLFLMIGPKKSGKTTLG